MSRSLTFAAVICGSFLSTDCLLLNTYSRQDLPYESRMHEPRMYESRMVPSVYSNGTIDRYICDRTDYTTRTNTIGNWWNSARMDIPGVPRSNWGAHKLTLTGCQYTRATDGCGDFLSTGNICRCKGKEQNSGRAQTKHFSGHNILLSK